METTTKQLSGTNSNGKCILALVAKRTYTINDNGSCTLSDEQDPLYLDVIHHPESSETILHDSDLYHYKPFTDIVVKGIARNTTAASEFNATIEISKSKLNFALIGNRKVHKNTYGKLVFSEPDTIDKVPLTYKFAYGGKDLLAELPLREKIKNDPAYKYTENILDIFEGSPFRYPRNPTGKGYIIEPSNEGLEALELPNIEDPNNRLTAQNLICTSPTAWHTMPVPVCSDWVSPGWFPRVGYYGLYQLPPTLDENIYEIKKGWADEQLLESKFRVKEAKFNFRFCNGASLGLQTKHLVGGESCRLVNIHPTKKEFIFKLPSERPNLMVDGRNGKLRKTDPVMHSVVIEPESKKLTVVWCGSSKAIRPYFDYELNQMPFQVDWN